MAHEERLQFAGEVIRFMQQRIPASRRDRVSFIVALMDTDDPEGPIITTPLAPRDTAFVLRRLAEKLEGVQTIMASAAPEPS